MIQASDNAGFVILGNQLFSPTLLQAHAQAPFFMAEDIGLCTYVRHHKQKLALFLASMRSYRDELRSNGIDVHYVELSDSSAIVPYEVRLHEWIRKHELDSITMWEIEDKFFETRILHFAATHQIRVDLLPSPMFLTQRDQFHEWLDGRHALMAEFYRWQRERLGILLEPDGRPRGGRWSFDADNRKALPKRMSIPTLRIAAPTNHVKEVIGIINARFADHPGELSQASWWLPTTRAQAHEWLDEFLERRLALFGPYEDALSERDPFLFHSVLTPTLNLGLLTPAEVIERALDAAQDQALPLATTEGFVRQIIGWREFIRGMYREAPENKAIPNFFEHRRSMSTHWRSGTTGLLPLDLVIRKALRWGWTHHIERLMVLGNLMTLCEIAPAEAHRFFMEMYVDSSDWVMDPNVYGMGLFADGGSFATKPYICSSNYILKMSDYSKPRADEHNWCEILDGLYWRFVAKHRDFFANQPRLQRTVSLFDRLEPKRLERILAAAENFLEQTTHSQAVESH